MTTLRIAIELDNDAFYEDLTGEVLRILRSVNEDHIAKLADDNDELVGFRDSNGNKCGGMTVDHC